jgi:hypothetical protein
MIVDFSEHKKHMGFCSSDCFDQSLNSLLIKDVDWDVLKIEGKYVTYKELRSLVKNGKMNMIDARSIVTSHLRKKLGDTTFPHKESQKEGVIQMD